MWYCIKPYGDTSQNTIAWIMLVSVGLNCFIVVCFSTFLLQWSCRKTFYWFQTFTVFWMLYAFFSVIPRRLNFISRRFGTLCSIFTGGQVWSNTSYLPAYEDGTDSVPKRRLIKFRCCVITEKKAYNRKTLFVGSSVEDGSGLSHTARMLLS